MNVKSLRIGKQLALCLLALLGQAWFVTPCMAANEEVASEKEANKKPDKKKECSECDLQCLSSIGYKIPFGELPFEEGLGYAYIGIHKDKPTVTIHTPSALFFASPAGEHIVSKVVSGGQYTIKLVREDGDLITYVIASGQSEGKSTTGVNATDRLIRLDADNNALTGGDPVYLLERHDDGSTTKLDYATGKAISYIHASGRVVDFAASNLEIIYDDSGIMRQIRSSKGLADIVTIGDDTYEVRLYSLANLGSKDANGLYAPLNKPYKVYRFDNPADNPNDYTQVRITMTQGSRSDVSDFKYSADVDEWSLTSGGGMKRESKYTYKDTSGNEYLVRVLLDKNSNVVSKRYSLLRTYAWGEKVVKEIEDPDGLALTSQYDYYSSGNGYAQLAWKSNADGSWEYYVYDASDRLTATYSPWLDSTIGTNAATSKVVTNDYTSLDSGDTVASGDTRPRTVTTLICGKTVSKTFHVYKTSGNAYTEIEEKAATPTASYGTSGNQRTTSTYYSTATTGISAGRLHTVAYPDGRLETHTYAEDASSPDAYYTETVTNGTTDSPDGIASKTERTVTNYNVQGLVTSVGKSIYIGSGYDLVDTVAYTYDDEYNQTATTENGRETHATTWTDGRRTREVDEQGIARDYVYDNLDRVISEVQEGAAESGDYAAQSDIITAYDIELGALSCGCNGKTVTTRTSGDGKLTLSSTSTTDKVGRPSETIDEAGYVTTYAYADGGLTTTVTNPGASTRITTKYPDGQTKSVTGTATVAEYYTYGVNDDGTRWTQINYAASTSPRFSKVTQDMLGRVVKEESPAYDGSTYRRAYTYNAKGQLVKIAEPGRAPTLMEYDALGNQTRSGLDSDGDGTLTLAGTDRISETAAQYQKIGDAYWYVEKNYVYATNGTAAATLTTETRRRASGLSGNLVSEQVQIDINGNKTTQTVTTDCSAKLTTATTTTTGSDLSAVLVTRNGLAMTKSTLTISKPTLYTYDALGRQTGEKSPATANYATTTYDAATGQVTAQTDACGNTTTYAYYAQGATGAGRVKSVTDPLGHTTYTAYDQRGETTHIWGGATYPQAYTYDEYGKIATLKTYRAGSDWDSSTWPTTTGDADTTTWTYQASTGLLTAKTDAAGKSATYTYTSANQLATRVWARGATTNYTYDDKTGELTGIGYSDGTTTNVSYAYDRLGRRAAIADATGTRTFAYNAALALETETLGDYYGAGKRLTRRYSSGTAGTDIIGRATGFDVGTSDTPAADYTVSYAYDAESRLNTVTDSAGTHTYTYDTNADRLSERASTAFKLRVSYAYEENRSLLTSIANTADGALVSKYAYANDAAGRRTSVANTGSAFAQSATNLWTYNAKSEVIGQTRHAGTDLTNLGESITSGSFAYDFDNIGNRTTSTSSAFEASYTSNALNQYSAIACTVPAQTFVPTYDADGNETFNGVWHYTWDGENRLTQAVNYAGSPVEGSKRLTFAYDYQSRRVRKTVETYASGAWATTSDEKYLSNGWNLVCAYGAQTLTSGNPTLTSTYTWGLDIAEQNDASRSGSVEPGSTAGGVGGLLTVNRITTSDATNAPTGIYAPIYDGNGNVTGLISTSGTSVAHYEYGPFGEVVSVTGAAKNSCPFGFSTKYTDEDTGLCYYGYRYYDAVTGRWLSRDPLEENGGLNVYGFVSNIGVSRIDNLGLACSWATGLCKRHVGGINIPSFVILPNSTIVPTWPLNYLIFNHHNVKVESYSKPNGKGNIEESIVRGFFPDSMQDAVYAFIISSYSSKLTGWVPGHIASDPNPGTCNMSLVSENEYHIVKNRILTWRMASYHLWLYNCQTWAAEQLSL
jgi:RHS repeat-associated protein